MTLWHKHNTYICVKVSLQKDTFVTALCFGIQHFWNVYVGRYIYLILGYIYAPWINKQKMSYTSEQ